jgi:hypothetical protein
MQMAEDITWRRLAAIWWLILWRGLVGGMVVGGVLGFVIGVVGAILGLGNSGVVAGIAGLMLSIVWGMFVLRMALIKKYSDFRLILVTDASLARH